MNGEGECKPCHKSCKTCDGPNANDCTSCNEDIRETLSNGECKCKSGSIEKDPIDTEC